MEFSQKIFCPLGEKLTKTEPHSSLLHVSKVVWLQRLIVGRRNKSRVVFKDGNFIEAVIVTVSYHSNV
jgi:hypothetical protein